MNSTISIPQFGPWKRIKTQYVVAAASVALVIAAVAGLFAFDSGGSTTIAPAAPDVASSRSLPQGQTFVYVVGSQAEADVLRQAFAEGALVDGGAVERDVMVIDSAQGEAALNMLSIELMHVGDPNLTLVDLRTPLTTPFGGDASEADPGAYPLVQEMSHPR